MRFPDDFDDEEPTQPVETEPRARVLIIEEDVDLRDSISDLMRRDFFEVIEADSGAEALDMLGDEELVEDIDLVVMDIDLPGAAGLEIVRTLRATQRDTPVVLIASIERPDILARAASLHVPVLSRPYVLQELPEVAIAVLTAGH